MNPGSLRATTIALRSSALALACAIFGCGGAVSRDAAGFAEGGVGGISAGLGVGDGGVSACDHYFAATYTRCGGPVVPPSELSRIRARFEQVCANEVALPGSGVSSASLEACASALDSSPCELPAGPPLECRFNGSLPGGATCADGIQCQTGSCQGTVSYSPEGQEAPFTCGTCLPAVAVGQVCGSETVSAGCPASSVCMTDDTTAAQPVYTCTAIAQGDVGAECDDLAASCKTGLYCSAQTAECASLADASAACGDFPGWPGGCTPPLSCVGSAGATCSLGSAGAFCLLDGDCSSGLGCVPGPCSSGGARIGCSESGTCEAVSWGAPGASCDGYISRFSGTCNFGSLFRSCR